MAQINADDAGAIHTIRIADFWQCLNLDILFI